MNDVTEQLHSTSERVGLQPVGVPRMLRMYCLQQWYGLADEALFEEINSHLADKGLLMRAGTIVDATIIAAPSSSKNAGNTHDPEMHQTKKEDQWHFGMKAHIGVGAKSGLIPAVVGTAAKVCTSESRRRG